MVFILVMLTVAVFLLAEWLLTRPAAAVTRAEGEKHREGIPLSIQSLLDRYFHPGHAWARFLSPRLAVVGIDDFTRKVMGPIDRVDLPAIGTEVEQGQPLWKVWHKNRALSQMSPVSGRVIAVNDTLLRTPSLANRSPYDEGWIAKVKSGSGKRDVQNLLHGSVAKFWLDSVKSQYVRRIAPNVSAVYQDGGELTEDIGSRLSDVEWQKVVREFFQQE